MKVAVPVAMTPDEIAARLRWWEAGTGSLYQRLADGLGRMIEQGHLVAGAALPPERELAAGLAVSRNTVAAAYARLRYDGLLETRHGSATRVASRTPAVAGAHRSDNAMAGLLRGLGTSAIDLTIGAPSAAPVVAEAFAAPATLGLDPATLTAGHGYHGAGLPALRTAIAELLSRRGLPTTSDQILVTNGAHQALFLLVEALARHGSNLVLEDLTYPGAIDIARRSGARVHALPIDERGADLGSLAAVARSNPVAAAVLVATFHNPTGATMPGDNRRQVVELARRYDFTVVDDTTLADIDHGGAAPPPLAALDDSSRVVTIGSLSKLYWGGLRLGWVRADTRLIDRLADRKALGDIGDPMPNQVIAAALLSHYDAVHEWRNQQVRASLDAAANALARSIPAARWSRPSGGPNLWVRLPGVDTTDLARKALKKGVAVIPGPLLSVTGSSALDRVRLPLYATPSELVTGIELLAAVVS